MSRDEHSFVLERWIRAFDLCHDAAVGDDRAVERGGEVYDHFGLGGGACRALRCLFCERCEFPSEDLLGKRGGDLDGWYADEIGIRRKSVTVDVRRLCGPIVPCGRDE